MIDLSSQLQKARILPVLPSLLSHDRSLYLVGGAVRDALRGRVSRDYDFATAFDPTEIAQTFAQRIAGTWFWLDSERRQSRVVRKLPSGPISYDFVPFRAASLDQDLRLRDFSFNAIALEITSTGLKPQPIDPLGGEAALNRCELVACGPSSFDDDPLRVLRGLRYALSLDAHINTPTLDWMRASVSALKPVAAERIGSELVQAFGCYKADTFCSLIESLGLENLVFGRAIKPRDRTEALSAFQHVQHQLMLLQKQRRGRAVTQVLDRSYQPGVTGRFILLLSAFTAGAKLRQAPAHFAQQWRLGRQVTTLMRDLHSADPAHWQSFQRVVSTDRARAIWMEGLGSFAEEILLWHLVFSQATGRDRSNALEALHQWPSIANRGRVPDLVSGHWIKQMRPTIGGADIGRLQREIKQAEMVGKIGSAADAKAWLLSNKH